MVYLLHFDKPYKHAKHYLGYCTKLSRRIQRHRRGGGACLIRVILAQKIDFTVARVWSDGDRTLERKLKQRGKSEICPICNPKQKKHIYRFRNLNCYK